MHSYCFFVKRAIWIALGVSALALAGCLYTPEVVKAFDRKYPAAESNKIITEYCQSCHNHRDFEPVAHMETAKATYKKKSFRNATECRTCHFVETQLMRNEIIRKTIRPRDVRD
ncbi:MAG: hypothetical protein A3K09_01500 [Nitrospinae bacterium RIFCSPLOWO2_12_FULL_47_7]|nr:MAG: hypothetical protein A3K09_01500 [Nitrospinae bacterium RIFCSPLOWO2_12_FULL_47_7]